MIMKAVLNEADKLLLENNISSIPITYKDIKAIAKSKGWLISSFCQGAELISALKLTNYIKNHCAFTLKHCGENIIMYDGELSYEEKIHCICHEFGHIVLEHTEDNYIVGYNQDIEIQSKQEQEAEAFAAEMMAPICVLRKMNIKTIEDLINTGLLSKNQSILHIENIKLSLPENETEFNLCNRIFPQKRAIPPTSIKFLYGFIICVAYILLSIGFMTNNDISDNTFNSNFVYVTVSGKSYHISDCYHIRGKDNLTCLQISEAEALGYLPCKDCIDITPSPTLTLKGGASCEILQSLSKHSNNTYLSSRSDFGCY